MSVPPHNSRRLAQDVLKLMKTYTVDVVEQSGELVVRFHGPPDTPYHGGIWKVLVHTPKDYPFKSPSVGFMNRIFHPNIDKVSGTVCLDVLNEEWSPLFDLNIIFDTFLPQLLTYPNPNDPLNQAAALLYIRRRQDFDKFVKKYVVLYATEAVLESSVGDSMDSHSSFSESSTDDEAKERESDQQ